MSSARLSLDQSPEPQDLPQGRNEPGAGNGRLPPRRSWPALVACLAGLAVAVLVVGFFLFADSVMRARPPADPQADGIVAFTGGPDRIEDAARLLGAGSAERLLISGVGERTSGRALARQSAGVAGLLSCCIDLGYEARDTRGNAAEAAKWARERGYRSLIVVTSSYHMPRSLAEMSRALPGVDLVPYPVLPEGGHRHDWRSDFDTFKLLASEYLKYIVARLA